MYHAFVKRLAKDKYHTDRCSAIQWYKRNIWDVVSELSNRQKCGTPLREFTTNGSRVNGRDLADSVNNHFISVSTSPLPCTASERHRNTATHTIRNSIMLLPVTPTGVFNTVNNFENNVAAAPDEFKPVPISNVSPLISDVLSHIINITLKSAIFPDALQIAGLCPIYKDGGENNVRDYRSIFVPFIVSKVF